jgi:signal transduction histidine kinase
MTVVLIVGSLLAAVLVDYVAPWPFVMTALYALPVLIAAHRLAAPGVALTLVGAVAVNLASAVVQGTPLVVTIAYSFGLVTVGYLGALFATERARAASLARASQQHAEAAEQARRRLQEYLGMVSHDQLQPLTTLLLSIELLRRPGTGLPEAARDTVDDIESAAHRVLRLSQDLMDAARIGAGRFAVRPVETDLVPVIREVLDLKRQTTNVHELMLEAPGRLEGRWDRERLGQLVANLVANAISYSPAGGRVLVSVAQVGDEVVVAVSDQGPGIAPERVGQLFLPFTRLDEDRSADGSGLGLYIVKAIAEAHGGRVWVDSAPGRGSTFSVALPLTTATGAHAARGRRRAD